MVVVDPALERHLRETYAAFARGDLDATLAAFRPDATMTNPEYAVDDGVRVGRDEVRAGLQSLHDQFEYAGVEIEELLEGPRGVLVVARMEARGRGSGAPLVGRFFHVFRMSGEQVVDFAWFRSLEEGREAVGL
jgi:ketosteroid isomerase-like protein